MAAYIVIGAQEHGKTTWVMNHIRMHFLDFPKYIFDIQDDYRPVCTPRDYRDLSGNFDGFVNRVYNVKNSIIVFEESAIFFDSKKRPEKIRNMLVSSSKRHNNTVIYFLFHSMRTVPLYLIDHAFYFVIHKTNELAGNVKDRFRDNPLIYESYAEVMRSTNKYEHKVIDIRQQQNLNL